MKSDFNLEAELAKQFGFHQFRPGQKPVLQSLLAGRNTLAILPTGAGKTLIYQLYGQMSAQLTVIVSPLLSLMADQVERMRYLGEKRVVAITSALDWHQRQAVLERLADLRFVYVSPEMLSNPQVLAAFQGVTIGLFVLDEAHCLSQWGPDFRPEYLNLHAILKALQWPLTLLLTATATKRVQGDIVKKLALAAPVNVITESIDRPNIFLAVQEVADQSAKQQRLLDLVTQMQGPGIVYFLSKKLADQTAQWLSQVAHVNAAAYHSELAAEDRFKVQHQFMTGAIDVICATSAFGMGIDKQNVRFVIHYHMPVDLESYMQEIGRAGRDGKQSIAVLLYQPGDEVLPANLKMNGQPDDALINAFYSRPKQFAAQAEPEAPVRILNFYYQHGFDQAQVTAAFHARKRQQGANLKRLLDYLLQPGCRRKHLLAAFDQTAPAHFATCCDMGRGELPLAELQLMRTDSAQSTGSGTDWQLIIQKLFKNNAENN